MSGGVQQVRVVLRALFFLQLAKGTASTRIAGMIPLTAQAIRNLAQRYQQAVRIGSTCTVDVAVAIHDANGAGNPTFAYGYGLKAAIGRRVTTLIQAFDVLGNFTDMRQFGMVNNTAGAAEAPGPHTSASILAMGGTRMTAQAKFPPANTIDLVDGTQFVDPDRTPGTTGALSNPVCSFNLSEVSVAKSTDLTITERTAHPLGERRRWLPAILLTLARLSVGGGA